MVTGVSHYGPSELLAVPAIRKVGTRISLEFSIARLWGPEQRIEGIAAALRDVTAGRQQETELRKRLAVLEPAPRADRPV